MLCPMLAARGWKQYKEDVLMHVKTDKDKLWELMHEGLMENFHQLVIGQVRACRRDLQRYIFVCVFVCAGRYTLGESRAPAFR